MPTRTLRTTFSHTSALPATLAMSSESNVRPAVLVRSLWQVTQFVDEGAGLR